jgi:hypothetical protein
LRWPTNFCRNCARATRDDRATFYSKRVEVEVALMSDDPQKQHSRWQDFWEKALPVIVGSIVGGLFAIVGSYFATDFQMKAQVRSHKSEEQLKVFARLMGRKLVTEQLNLSQAEARMFSDYNEEIWKRRLMPLLPVRSTFCS